MTPEADPFFTLDRDASSIAASLLAPVEGRYRLLAASVAPDGADPEAVLEDLAWRAGRIDPGLAGSSRDWRAWGRLEVRSDPAPRVCLVAASPLVGADLERAFAGAGWQIAGRFFEPHPDPLALGETCLDPETDAVAAGLSEAADDDERERMRFTWPLVGSIGWLRDDLAVMACGSFAERPEGIPAERLFLLPPPERVPRTSGSLLRSAARQVGQHLLGSGGTGVETDAREGLRTSVGSLAVLLGRRVEGLEVGISGASRTLATPDLELRHMRSAEGALLPGRLLAAEEASTAILRWCAVGGDPAALADRLRQLRLRPWAPRDRETARLHLGALRAALIRLQQEWEPRDAEGRPEEEAAEVVVLAGGAFSAPPPPAVLVALSDGTRHPGAATVLHDHARVLGPLGVLADEGSRRRLIADLMDDCLLPLGSTLLTGPPEEGRSRPTMTISTPLGTDELVLEPDQLRVVDLPPGMVARVGIDPGDGAVLGVRGRHLALEVSGGLGGLLVDTRATPLPLPDAGERRRAALERWESAAWGEALP